MATAPIRVEVVNAFVSALVSLLRTCGQNARVSPLALVNRLPGAPTIAVKVHMKGSLDGPVTWAFEPEIAHLLIQHLFALDAEAAAEISTHDAVSELSNIVVGNATDKLVEAGYSVELDTPLVSHNEIPDNCHLPQGAIRVAVETAQGQVDMLLSLSAQQQAA